MNAISKFALAIAGLALAAQASAQVTLYERDGFQGRAFVTDREVWNLDRYGFNGRASSVLVTGNRGERWEVCDDIEFRGRCVVLRPGEYPSLAALGLSDRVSSVRAIERNAQVDDYRYAPSLAPPVAAGQIVFYADEDFRGRSHTAAAAVEDFRSIGFNDRASSIVVQGGAWEVCEAAGFGGRCVVLRRGEYRSLAAMGLADRISSTREVGRDARNDGARSLPVASTPVGRLDLYEDERFQGRLLSAGSSTDDLRASGFKDRASSAVVVGQPWEVCDDARFRGRCVVLRPGQYPSLMAMGLNDRISSVRAIDGSERLDASRYAPLPLVANDYRRRDNERLYQANVTSVRAVVEESGRQCWVDPEQAVVAPERAPNVRNAVLGAVIGGILGHQVGGGTGRNVATGIGVVAGAAIGANTGRGDEQQVVTTQGVQRCSRDNAQAQPAYWDVTYTFRGQDYRVQMSRQPGATVTVNEQGEPRA